MAVIGGVQGATIYKIPQVQAAASLALEALDQNIFTVNNQVSVGNALNSLSQLPPLNMFSPMSVNLRDNIPANDKSMTPLQFASPITAECRIWYMPQDILNVTNTWERIANKQYRCADSGRNPVQAQPVTTSAAMSRRGNGVGKLVLAVTFCSFALVGYIW